MDEPTRGSHAADEHQLIGILRWSPVGLDCPDLK